MPRKEHRVEKRCPACNEIKVASEFGKNKSTFDGLQGHCKECRRKYYKKNKTEICDRMKKNYKNNRKRKILYQKEYQTNNASKYRSYQRQYHHRPEARERREELRKKRFEENPKLKIRTNLSIRLWGILKNIEVKKSRKTMELVGCDLEYLKEYLEKQFVDGMTWKNYGEIWHVDHALPCNSFDLSDPEQQKRCFHYTNLQPLFATDNMEKGAKIFYDRRWTENGWVDNVP